MSAWEPISANIDAAKVAFKQWGFEASTIETRAALIAGAGPTIAALTKECNAWKVLFDAANADVVQFSSFAHALQQTIAAKDAEIARLRKAMKPFAKVAQYDISDRESDANRFCPITNKHALLLKVGDFRRAHAALIGPTP